MYKSAVLIALISSGLFAQTIERRVVDIVYVDKVIRTTHQVVLDTELEVGVIRAEETKPEVAQNVVITANDERLSYLELNEAAMREQSIYDEVNRRTEDAPYTVLFTGHIPAEIQKKRMAMMPEVGLFGDQKDKLLQNQGDITQEIGFPTQESNGLDTGDFSNMSPQQPGSQNARNSVDSELDSFINGKGRSEVQEDSAPQVEQSNDDMLEKLIGG